MDWLHRAADGTGAYLRGVVDDAHRRRSQRLPGVEQVRVRGGPNVPPSGLGLVNEASAQLAGSLDYGTTLKQVACLAVPELADWCTVDVLGDDGRIQRVAAAHADPMMQPLLYETLWRYPIHLHEPRDVAIALRTGQPQLEATLTNAHLRTVARDEDHLRILQTLRPRSSLVVPLIAHGRRLRALSLTAHFVHRAAGHRRELSSWA